MSAPDPERAARAPGLRRAAAALLVVMAAAAAALALIPGDSRSAGERAAYPATFPAGPGAAIAERACLFCHSPMLVTQQAKDSTAWEKSIVTMEKWGAPLTPAEHDTLVRYLLARFGPRPAAK